MMHALMKPIEEIPQDRLDGRLLHVSDGSKEWIARWAASLITPGSGRFYCYDGGACDLYLNKMTHWADLAAGVNHLESQ